MRIGSLRGIHRRRSGVPLPAPVAVAQHRVGDGRNDSAPIQKLESGDVSAPATSGDLWLHPTRPREILAAGGAPGLVAERSRTWIGQAEYDSVLTVCAGGTMKGIWISDLASGVLLESSIMRLMGPERDAKGKLLSAGSIELRFTTFESSRMLELRVTGPMAGPSFDGLSTESFAGSLQGTQLGVKGTTTTVTVNGIQQPFPTDGLTLSRTGVDLNGTVAVADGTRGTFKTRRDR